MSRNKGTAIFAVNFEPTGQSPLDARLVVSLKSDLTNSATYADNNIYNGMVVSVLEDNSLWMLTNMSAVTSLASWKQIDSGSTSAEIAALQEDIAQAQADIIANKVVKGDNSIAITQGMNTSVKVAIATGSNDLSLGSDGLVVAPYTADNNTLTLTGKQFKVSDSYTSARTAEVNAAKAALTGESSDASSEITLYGVKKYAQEQAAAASSAAGDVADDLTAHINNKSNPHKVTKDQVGLGNVTNDAQVKRSEMGAANGVATLDENGKIPSTQLNGQLASVQGVDQVVTSSTLPGSPEAQDMVWCTDDKKFREWNGSSWDVIDPKEDTIYNFRNSDATGSTARTNILYRWDGQGLTEISASIAIGETTGTAYDGAKGAYNRAAIASNPSTVVTGFGAVTTTTTTATIPFTDSDKNSGTNKYAAGGGGSITIPAATTSKAGLLTSADKTKYDNAVTNVGTLQTTVSGHTSQISTINNSYLPKATAGIGVLANYSIAATAAEITASDTINSAIGKLEKKLNDLSGDGDGSVQEQIQEAITALVDGAAQGYQTLGELEDKIKANATNISTLTANANTTPTNIVTGFSTVSRTTTAVTIPYTNSTKASGKYSTGSGGNISLPLATTSLAGMMAPGEKAKVALIDNSGDGTQFLSDDGTYKEVAQELSSSYAPSTATGGNLAPKAGDSYETAIGKLDKAISDNETAVAADISAINTAVGLTTSSALPSFSDTTYLKTLTSIVQGLKTLDSTLNTLNSKVTSNTNKLTTIQGAETVDGSIKKALKDAKNYTDQKLTWVVLS